MPGAPVALDQRDRRGWAPGSRRVRLRRVPRFLPGFRDRVDPRPRRLDLVAAHEQRLVAADHVEQQPLVGVRAARTELLGEAHVERHVAQPHAAGARILDHQPQLDAFVRLDAQNQPVFLDGAGVGVEDRVRNLAESDHDFGFAHRQPLACAHVERHPRPAPVVDLGLERDEGLGRARGVIDLLGIGRQRTFRSRAVAILPAHDQVRGQYRDGSGPEGALPAYTKEVNNSSSTTETFIALKAEIDNWRWAGVPFYVRTGKRLPVRESEIVVAFRKIPHSIFDANAGTIEENRLVLRIQPDEGVKLWLMIKDPGPGGMRLRYVPLDMSFAEQFGARSPDAYERLLLDVIRGNQTLFMRRDEVEAAWAWIDPIAEAWEKSRDAPKPYPAGTWGPTAAIALIERDGRTWHDESA